MVEQVFPKHFLPQSIFIVGGVILINNSTNLKQEKIQSQLTILIKTFSAKNPKEHFSKRNNNSLKQFIPL